jgi:hypothetical protein
MMDEMIVKAGPEKLLLGMHSIIIFQIYSKISIFEKIRN